MTITPRYTSRDLELMPDVEGVRYEIIDGELHVSKMPHWEHQYTIIALGAALHVWDTQTGRGVTMTAPGLVFAEDEDVAPGSRPHQESGEDYVSGPPRRLAMRSARRVGSGRR